MDSYKNKIERFIDDIVLKEEYHLLDLLLILVYNPSSKSGYDKNKEIFTKMFAKTSIRNLQQKYGLNSEIIKNHQHKLLDFLNSIPEFLSYDTYYKDRTLSRALLTSKCSSILVNNVKTKVLDSSDLEKQILSFFVNYIPLRIQEAKKEAGTQQLDWLNYFSDFIIDATESGDIDSFRISPKEWTYIFNTLFGKELKEYEFKIKSYKKPKGIIIQPQTQYDLHSFWQLGDELVKLGIGYWIAFIGSSGNVDLELIIPHFIYENIRSYTAHFPQLKDFDERINEIKMTKEPVPVTRWRKEDLDIDSEISESELEQFIIANPESLEEGLEFIDNQYQTDVGRIDILCKDKERQYVVVELKSGGVSGSVVGQIQKYMIWVIENLADDDKPVRGIIVAKRYDKALKNAIRGSKFERFIKILENRQIVQHI